MIALDANVLVQYLVCDDPEQAEAAREVLESLDRESPGFVCREATLELVRTLEEAYACSREEIAELLEDLTATEHLIVEAGQDVAVVAMQYGEGGADFADRMVLAAAKRAGCRALRTFDEKTAELEGAELLGAAEGTAARSKKRSAPKDTC